MVATVTGRSLESCTGFYWGTKEREKADVTRKGLQTLYKY